MGEKELLKGLLEPISHLQRESPTMNNGRRREIINAIEKI
jgi:hypothetical protein